MLFAISMVVPAQLVATPPSFAADSAGFDKPSIIAAVTSALEEHYVYPSVAEQMASYVRGKLQRGEYDEITDLDAFARQLTVDLRGISEDGHIAVYRFDPAGPSTTLGDAPSEQDIAQHARENFGFAKAERLTGNVGYLKFDYFDYPEIAGSTATAAMNFIANCDSVIFDLRDNRGGKENMVQFLASFFFRETTHLLTVYDRNNEIIKQSWSLAYVPG